MDRSYRGRDYRKTFTSHKCPAQNLSKPIMKQYSIIERVMRQNAEGHGAEPASSLRVFYFHRVLQESPAIPPAKVNQCVHEASPAQVTKACLAVSRCLPGVALSGLVTRFELGICEDQLASLSFLGQSFGVWSRLS